MRPARRDAESAYWCASAGSSSRASDAATRYRATQSAFSLLRVFSSRPGALVEVARLDPLGDDRVVVARTHLQVRGAVAAPGRVGVIAMRALGARSAAVRRRAHRRAGRQDASRHVVRLRHGPVALASRTPYDRFASIAYAARVRQDASAHRSRGRTLRFTITAPTASRARSRYGRFASRSPEDGIASDHPTLPLDRRTDGFRHGAGVRLPLAVTVGRSVRLPHHRSPAGPLTLHDRRTRTGRIRSPYARFASGRPYDFRSPITVRTLRITLTVRTLRVTITVRTLPHHPHRQDVRTTSAHHRGRRRPTGYDRRRPSAEATCGRHHVAVRPLSSRPRAAGRAAPGRRVGGGSAPLPCVRSPPSSPSR